MVSRPIRLVASTCIALLALTVNPVPAQSAAEESLSEEHRLYEAYCSACHGPDLRGGRGPDLRDHDWLRGSGRDDIVTVISEGVEEQGMPAYANELSERQIALLADYILGGGQGGVAIETPGDLDIAEITRPLETLDYEVGVEVWLDDLSVPWGIAFVDVDTALITERPGRLRRVEKGKLQPEPIEGTPEIFYPEGTQGGLLDVALDPAYERNGWIYLSYSHSLPEVVGEKHRPSMLRVIRGRIRNNRWVDEQLVLSAAPDSYPTTPPYHYGGRLLFGPDQYLYVTIGERYGFEDAQNLQVAHGKIHRVHRDGTPPKDNPFVGQKDAVQSIFSYGHRNPQGVALHPDTGALWAAEHGPMGGDELNLVTPGTNYGWPTITYGINYDGSALTPHRRRAGMAQPLLYWRPSIAVSGIAFYQGNLFPRWRGKLLAGALKQQELRLLDIEQNRIMHQEVLMRNRGQVREVAVGPDGAVYLLMHKPGRVLRLTPQEERLL